MGPGLLAKQARQPNIIVIFTDDQGYADLGVQDVVDDIKTPNIDALARAGVRCTSGYITAPQCTPSRAGLITGRYQQRFGMEAIADLPLPLDEVTIADRLKAAGYTTGVVGKWHLQPSFSAKAWLNRNREAIIEDPSTKIGRNIELSYRLPYLPGQRGFDYFYCNVPPWVGPDFWANYKVDGTDLNPEGEYLNEATEDRLQDETDAALTFIRRNLQKPFFLYLAYSGPHTPLYIVDERREDFPGEMAERRRAALAMMATMDDGVGDIMTLLKKHQLENDTLIFFTSDNGAPLKMTKEDSPLTKMPGDIMNRQHDMGGWDGSLNDPLAGEKGMLTEGGIRVPFIVTWPGTIPGGQVYTKPVSALDITPTALAAAHVTDTEGLDGVDLLPYFKGSKSGQPHDALYWRFWKQAAVRSANWKLLYLGDGSRFLFDVNKDPGEKDDLSQKYPDKVKELEGKLTEWSQTLRPKGLPKNGIQRERRWYKFYLDHPEG